MTNAAKTRERKELNIHDRVQMAMVEMESLLERKKLSMRPVVSFPRRRKPPLLSRLCLWLIGVQGGIMDLEFKSK